MYTSSEEAQKASTAQSIHVDGLGLVNVQLKSNPTTSQSIISDRIRFFAHFGDVRAIDQLFGPFDDEIINAHEGMDCLLTPLEPNAN